MRTKKKTAVILLAAGLCVSAVSGYMYADDYDGGNSNIFCRGQMSKMCKSEDNKTCGFYIQGSNGRIICTFPDRSYDGPQEIITEEGSKDPVPAN